jgi:hypothetical protein
VSPIVEAYALARLLYARASRDGDLARLGPIAAAGATLKKSVEMSRCARGSLGHRAAPMRAAEGLQALVLLGWPTEIELARERVIEPQKAVDPRAARKVARR